MDIIQETKDRKKITVDDLYQLLSGLQMSRHCMELFEKTRKQNAFENMRSEISFRCQQVGNIMKRCYFKKWPLDAIGHFFC